MRKILLIIFVILICSCRKEPTDFIPIESLDLDTCSMISYQEVAVDKYLLSYPTGMSLIDDKLIIKDNKGQQNLFHMITTEGKYLQEFLKVGGGPEEYLTSNFNFQLSEEHELGVFDSSRKRLLFFGKQKEDFKFLSAYELELKDENVIELVKCGNYYLAMGTNGRFEDNRFMILDSLGNVKKMIGDYPKIDPSLFDDPKDDLRTLLFHTPFLRLSPDGNKAVFASYKGALIQFLDLSVLPDSIGIKTIQLERPKKKEQVTRNHEGWVYGFEDVYVTDEHIYTIYNGETAVDNPELGRYILKYDWNGHLLEQYKSDIGLRCLAVDEKSGTLFFVGYVNDEMKLYFAPQLFVIA